MAEKTDSSPGEETPSSASEKPAANPFDEALSEAKQEFEEDSRSDLLIERPRSPWKKRMAYGLIALAAIGFIGLLSLWAMSLPDFKKNYPFRKIKRQAVQRVENQLPSGTRHRWVSFDSINRELVDAIVFAEDSTFFAHDGVNYNAIWDAFLVNLKRFEYARGGSTISQQVVKNVFLTKEKSILRKAREFVITGQLEDHLKKRQILEVYLNIAELGPDIYGVHAASEHYFDKLPSEVNAAEGAFLSLMLPSPKKNYRRVFEQENINDSRRKKIRRILRDMAKLNRISPDQFEQYMKFTYFTSDAEWESGELGRELEDEAADALGDAEGGDVDPKVMDDSIANSIDQIDKEIEDAESAIEQLKTEDEGAEDIAEATDDSDSTEPPLVDGEAAEAETDE